jgi:hypothetical protein
MLDGVGDEHGVAIDAGLIKSAVENPPGRSHERSAGDVLLDPGCSPTCISRAPRLPSPGTAWVALR